MWQVICYCWSWFICRSTAAGVSSGQVTWTWRVQKFGLEEKSFKNWAFDMFSCWNLKNNLFNKDTLDILYQESISYGLVTESISHYLMRPDTKNVTNIVNKIPEILYVFKLLYVRHTLSTINYYFVFVKIFCPIVNYIRYSGQYLKWNMVKYNRTIIENNTVTLYDDK